MDGICTCNEVVAFQFLHQCRYGFLVGDGGKSGSFLCANQGIAHLEEGTEYWNCSWIFQFSKSNYGRNVTV